MKSILSVIAAFLIMNIIIYSLIRCVEAEEAIRLEQDKNRVETCGGYRDDLDNINNPDSTVYSLGVS
jgi:hypothetical protein